MLFKPKSQANSDISLSQNASKSNINNSQINSSRQVKKQLTKFKIQTQQQQLSQFQYNCYNTNNMTTVITPLS